MPFRRGAAAERAASTVLLRWLESIRIPALLQWALGLSENLALQGLSTGALSLALTTRG